MAEVLNIEPVVPVEAEMHNNAEVVLGVEEVVVIEIEGEATPDHVTINEASGEDSDPITEAKNLPMVI